MLQRKVNGSHVYNSPFFAGVWIMQFCQEHKAVFIESYAPTGATALIISTLTASVGVHYELGGL
jgi:hypothetical protein